jgi:6-pyruvoyltetrahydropterin/6-carboxytetrahydropterin synthase
MPRSDFKISVSKDYLVFSSAHFITLPGDRCEPLHGHNYRTRITVEGGLEPEAHYVFDFSELKQVMKRLTDEIDHKVLLPLENAKLAIEEQGDRIAVAHDGVPRYQFPRRECALLPIPNTTVEMLARYLAERARAELEGPGGLRLRALEVEVEENFGQSATYRAAFD